MTAVQIDHRAYPHIIDRIFSFAPRSSLLALRAACVDWRCRAHAHLVVHLSPLATRVTLTTSGTARVVIPQGRDTTESALARGAHPRHLPPLADWETLALRVRVLDVDLAHIQPEWRGRISRLPNVRVIRDYGNSASSADLPRCDLYVTYDRLPRFRHGTPVRKNGMLLMPLKRPSHHVFNFQSWFIENSFINGRERDDIELAILFHPPAIGPPPPSRDRRRLRRPPSPYDAASRIAQALGRALWTLRSPHRISLINSLSWRAEDPYQPGTHSWEQDLIGDAHQSRELQLLSKHERDRTLWEHYLLAALRRGMEGIPEGAWTGSATADERLGWVMFETISDFKARVGEEKFELALAF